MDVKGTYLNLSQRRNFMRQLDGFDDGTGQILKLY
jgi:hypothetical protein